MQNKSALMHIVSRAERGVLLPEEAKILRDAIELLDDMATTLDMLSEGAARYSAMKGYEPSTTQSFRVIEEPERSAEDSYYRELPPLGDGFMRP